ncbi:type II CRISPR RNA-guided endonuclease Cas9 [Alkalibacter saccharofermentans]|uniref:CRISPR-associated endonuclease Cas9 n=1 Tax=Alkalibacter saccharofermentans DSM 14828 TaxID=1120975 RepID=A0A1M4Z2G1_9FIRM|nr:type II CRISPR RNA-guided endonuclease Cas9 [Alkalibacter saccharofermentans]SHF11786.1 CRISPR-associated endonuclease Csn1 [Alkalibacter saccharofermentans DSM 14828]
MKKQNDYFLGLDIGTSSIGWAATDVKYKLLRAKGKDLWGVRLFKEAETAMNRRTFRISRRRRQREVGRIGLLKEIFAEEIQKVDSSFYQRLDESKYHANDKSTDFKYVLFTDKNFTDQDYYIEYPTVFHLRKELIECKDAHDIRLVFLAILNLFKHRGHFLNASLDAEQSMNFNCLFEDLCKQLEDKLDIVLDSSIEPKNIEEILVEKGLSRTRKAEKIAIDFGVKKSKDKVIYELIKGISGLTISIDVIFGEEYVDDDNKKISFSFRDSNYDEEIAKVSETIGEAYMEVVNLLKAIHDQALLANVMQGHKYLSEARVESHKKHHEDLVILKKIIKKYAIQEYDSIFRSDGDGSYSAYVGSVNSRSKQRRNMKKRNAENLYATIKKVLKKCPEEDPDVKFILNEITNENFLPKQLTAANGVIPNQVHLAELKAILRNASMHLDFLNEEDASGLTASDKIIALFSFQIPYYVGPLNNYHADKGGNAWVVRKCQGKILPWNIDEMIDEEKTSEAFIERLIRKCTYMKDEAVLPKSSLLYEKYMVLNELNNLKIRGEKPSVELKQEIFKELFLTGKKVSRKKLNEFLISKGQISKSEITAVTGVDGDFMNTLGTFGKFHGIFGDSIFEDETISIVEQIVFWGTVYGDDKKFYKEKLKRELSDKLNTEQIKRISGFKFRDWGRLSREFLEMTGFNKATGEMLPLIQMLWHYNENLMEILSDRYTFTEKLINEYSTITKALSEIKYEDLEELYLSAPVRRMVWQTLLIVKELEAVLGNAPKRIFVEMARENGEKGKRTTSRKQRLIELYKNCKKDARDWVGELNNLEDSNLRSKKLYLYYTQNGRCMYTGEPIDLEKLMNDNLYDIDHIYPRRYVKDDSLENNLVLVKKQINAHKSDQYPIEESIYKSQHTFWKSLLTKDMKNAFITREKYNRLINRNPLSDEQLAGFISRQIVETRQGTKAITQILNQAFFDSEMVFVKAANISDFRHDFDLIKVRSVNDFHHAQDAYLSCVVGNSYYVKFTKDPLNFIQQFRRNDQNGKYHMNKLFYYTIKRGDEIAWTAGENSKENSISTVKEMMYKNTPLITKMTFEGHGELFKATLYSAKKSKQDSYVPLKQTDLKIQNVQKYGGYSSISTAHLFLVEHEIKGKRIRTLEALPLMLRDSFGMNLSKLNAYCEDILKLKEPDVRLSKIKLQSLVKRDGFYMNITGKTNNQFIASNAVSLIIKRNWLNYIKKVEKAVDIGYTDKEISSEKNIELYNELLDKHKNSIYSKRPNPIGETLKNGQIFFDKLNLLEQCTVLNQILQISQLSNMGANLELINGSKKSGMSLISKNVSSVDEFILVNQSITGLYRSEIDLLTI